MKYFIVLLLLSSFAIHAQDQELVCQTIETSEEELAKVKKRRDCRIVKKRLSEQPQSEQRDMELKRIENELEKTKMDFNYEVDIAVNANLDLTKKNKTKIAENKKLSEKIDEDLKVLDEKQTKFEAFQKEINNLNEKVILQHFDDLKDIQGRLAEHQQKIQDNRTQIDLNTEKILENYQLVTDLLKNEASEREQDVQDVQQELNSRYESLQAAISSKLTSVCNQKCNCGPQQ